MATMSAKGGWGPSKMATVPMCMWLTSSSIWRNEASSGLSRSVLTDHSLHEGLRVRSDSDGTTATRRFLLVGRPGRSRPGAAAPGTSAGGGGRVRLAQTGEERVGVDPVTGLLIGC